jgi:tight adherence protein B
MSPVLGFIIFLVLFAVIMVAISLSSRYIEMRGKKQVESMVNPEKEGSDEDVTASSILVDPDAQKDALETFLERSEHIGSLQTLLQQAGLPWSAGRLLIMMLVGGLGGALLGAWLQPLGFMLIGALMLGFFLGGTPWFYVQYKRKKRMAEFEEQLPEALEFLARSMRAGHAFSIGLEMLGTESPDPIGQEFRALFAEQNLGAPLDTALRNFARRVPLLDVSLFVSSVLLQRQTGGNLGEVLTRLAFLIRERFRLRGQVKAASAHGKMTSLVLTALPIVMIFALQIVAPGYLPGLAKDPDGRWMIVGAVVAQILGYYFMRKITNIKV